MSEQRALAQYGLKPAQENFVSVYTRTGDIEEAAKASSRSEATCREWLRNPKVQQAIQRELQTKLSGGAMSALDVLIHLDNNSEDEKVKLQAAKDMLDRAGYKPEHLHTTADKRMEGASLNEMLSRIEELQRDLGMGSGKTIDVTPTKGEATAEPPAPPQPGDEDVPEPPSPVEPQNTPQPPAKSKTPEPEPEKEDESPDTVAEVDTDLTEEISIEELM
jgi:phage terminase small subunit